MKRSERIVFVFILIWIDGGLMRSYVDRSEASFGFVAVDCLKNDQSRNKLGSRVSTHVRTNLSHRSTWLCEERCSRQEMAPASL